MRQNLRQKLTVICTLLLGINTVLAYEKQDESFDFHAYYQGTFSGNKKINIADLHWQTSFADRGGEQGVMETQLHVSSKAYNYVEKLYPFRLFYRSLAKLQPMRTIAYESYDSTDEHGREFVWLDINSTKALRFREDYVKGRASENILPAVLATWGTQLKDYFYYKTARYAVVSGLLDEVALLQKIRQQNLSVGEQFEWPVTDGKRRYNYKVYVVGREQLLLDGKAWNAWKIRLDGYRIKRGISKQEDDSIWVWLADTRERTPLRFEHRNKIGRFVIDLVAINRS